MLSLLAVLALGYLVPERLVIPVAGATTSDWNDATFWYEPWGASGVHKGIDIFAPKGKDVLAATGGLVVFSGNNRRGETSFLSSDQNGDCTITRTWKPQRHLSVSLYLVARPSASSAIAAMQLANRAISIM